VPARDPIQSLWIGKTLGTLEQLSIRSFLDNGHPYHLYLYGPVEGLPPAVQVFDANQVLPESEVFYYRTGSGRGSPAGFSNRFRYKLLLDRGGWWCDLDVVCLKPFLFERDLVLAAQRRRSIVLRTVLNNGIMRAPRDSPLMRACYRGATAAGASVSWGQTGPRLLSRHFCLSWVPRQLLRLRWALRSVQAASVFQPVDWWEAKEIVNPGREWDLSGSYAVHLWNEMWRANGVDKDGTFDPGCLYERLKTRYSAGVQLVE
jgi:hypothetical protein